MIDGDFGASESSDKHKGEWIKCGTCAGKGEDAGGLPCDACNGEGGIMLTEEDRAFWAEMDRGQDEYDDRGSDGEENSECL